MTTFHLVFNGILTPESGNALRGRMVSILERQDCESLTLVFSSDGGSNNESFALYNFIRELPLPLHIHAAGPIGSAAVPVFLAGARRTCAPISRFFFHAADWTFPPDGQQSDRIAEAMMSLDDDGRLARKIAAERARRRSIRSTAGILLPQSSALSGLSSGELPTRSSNSIHVARSSPAWLFGQWVGRHHDRPLRRLGDFSTVTPRTNPNGTVSGMRYSSSPLAFRRPVGRGLRSVSWTVMPPMSRA